MSAVASFKKRKLRVRNKISNKNKSQRSKIVVFRSNKNIHAQLIGIDGKVIHSFSSVLLEEKDSKGVSGINIAKIVGEKFAKICVEGGVKEVVFDKGAYLYSGRVKVLAESCRSAGLKF
jgi:large subunit ribosomal protein L18